MRNGVTMQLEAATPDIDDEAVEGSDAQPVSALERLSFYAQSTNIAEHLDDTVLARLGQKAIEEYEIDLESRKAEGWDDRTKAAMDRALQVKEAKNYPWPNASNVKYPLVTTAAIQFNARAYPAIVDGMNVVKGKVLGKGSPEKQARADRVAKHMTFQLLEEMPGWEEDTDRMLVQLPIVGSVIRKTWFDTVAKVNRAESILPNKFVVNYWTRSLDTCPRMTQVLDPIYPHQIKERQRAGIWLDVELGLPTQANGDELAPHEFLEQHRLEDLDGDEYPEPYIVTVHKETGRVVRIVAGFEPDGVENNAKGEVVRIERVCYFTKYPFIPAPDGSFYDIGFGQLLDALNDTINSTINQLMDAGHLSNTQGGFIGGGISIKSGPVRFQPGEWKKVGTDGQVLKDNIVPLPVRDPSNVLFQLLGMLVEASKDITATKDILTGETEGANQAVGTTLAMIEQGLKVFTAIYKRIHRALKGELKCLRSLNHRYLEPEVYFNFQDEEGVVSQADYAPGDMDVLPVSDPTVVTDMQKMGRANFLLQFAGDPEMNGREIKTRVLEAAAIPDIDALFARQAPPDPKALVETAKLENEQERIDLDRKRFAIEAAERKATIVLRRAETLKVLSEIGGAETVTDPETGETVDVEAPEPNVPPAAVALMDMLDEQADAEIAEAIASTEETEQPDEVQPDDMGGMEGEPADGGVPDLPEGPAVEAGGPVDDGSGAFPGAPGEGAVDGGVGELGMV
jgi:chaperonin GroES